MHIGAILKEKGGAIHSTTPETRLQEVVAQLLDRHVGCLVVLSPAGELAGIITERDIVRTLRGRPAAWIDTPVAEVMTTQLYTAGPDATLQAVIGEMRERRIRHLPVMVEGRLAGVLSIRDLIKAAMTELERHNQMLKRFIANWPGEES